jgi:hypothetical protein
MTKKQSLSIAAFLVALAAMAYHAHKLDAPLAARYAAEHPQPTPTPTARAVEEETSAPAPVYFGIPELTEFSWSRGGFDSVLLADFTIRNNKQVDIKDIVVHCYGLASSGTHIDDNERTIYQVVRAGQTKHIYGFSMGFLNSQVATLRCGLGHYVTLTPEETSLHKSQADAAANEARAAAARAKAARARLRARVEPLIHPCKDLEGFWCWSDPETQYHLERGNRSTREEAIQDAMEAAPYGGVFRK